MLPSFRHQPHDPRRPLLARLRRCRVGLLVGAIVAIPAQAAAPDQSAVSSTGVPNSFRLTLPLLFDGVYQGDVAVIATADGKISVDVERFVALMGPRLSPELIQKVKDAASTNSAIPIEGLNAIGITANYDPAKLELRISVPVAQQGARSISAYERGQNGLPSPLTIAPAPVSGSATFTARQTYDWGSGGTRAKFSPLRLSADVAANIGGPGGIYVLAQGEFDGGGAERFRRGNIVAIHDDLKRAIRYAAGDVAPIAAGFQSAPTIGGISIQRQYGELRPFANIRPSGQFSFLLERPSTVDVVVNGSVLRTIQLDAGQYNLRDFPFFNGLNQVELYVVDPFGRRLLASFSQYFSARLLNQGVFEFGATGGVLERTGQIGSRYNTDRPSFSGYVRYGLTPSLTVGGNAQFSTNQWMAGGELGWATPIGTVGVLAALSRFNGVGTGSSLLVSYEASARRLGFLERPQFNLEFQKVSRAFTPLTVTLPINRYQYEVRSRFSTQLPGEFGFGIAASFARGRDLEPDEQRYAVNVSRRFRILNVTASYERVVTRGPARDSRFLLTFSLPIGRSQSLRASYDTRDSQYSLEYSRFQRDELDTVGIRAALVRANGGITGSGEVSYNGNRFGALLQHNVISDANLGRVRSQQTSYTIATQLAFANGRLAVGRPVGPRFAIVAAHSTLEGAAIGVSQGVGRDKPQARTGRFGPALAPVGNSYTPTQLRIDAEKVPTGYDIGPGQYELFPGIASGYRIQVGSDASRIVLGNLVAADGKPIALQGGEIRSLDTPSAKPILIFTNSTGRFVASGLAPGRYEMRLGPQGDIVVPLVVPKEAKGLIDAGTIKVGK